MKDRSSERYQRAQRRGAVDVVIVAPDRSDVGEFAHALSESAYDVQLVHDPQRVAQAVVGGRPDVVVVDLRCSKVTGTVSGTVRTLRDMSAVAART